MSLPKGYESPSNNNDNSGGAGKNIAGAVIVLVLVLGGSLAVAMFWWDSAHDTDGNMEKVDVDNVECTTKNGRAYADIKLSNDNNYGVIVTWKMYQRDASQTILSSVEGYSNIPAHSTVNDNNFDTLHPRSTGCLAKITEVTKIP